MKAAITLFISHLSVFGTPLPLLCPPPYTPVLPTPISVPGPYPISLFFLPAPQPYS